VESRQDQAEFYRKLREERHPDDRHGWIYLIKELRVRHGCGIDEAHRIALSQPQWKRWVERQINVDHRCRRMAIRHMRDHGDAAMIQEQNGRLVVS
jgi:hypothetical protein